MAATPTPSSRKRKIAAVAAGALVVGIGATYTLASWTDSEWVWGGAGSDPAIATENFNIQQDTTVPFANSGWADKETKNGGDLTFSAGALQLTPGDTIYAPVALRTDSNSLAAKVTLQGAVKADNATSDDALWDAVRVSVYTQNSATSPFTPGQACSQAGVAALGSALISNAPLGTGATSTQSLAKESTSVQHYCFAITLPEAQKSNKTLQGKTIAPAWEFKAESVAE